MKTKLFKKTVASVSAISMLASMTIVPITANAATTWYSQDFTDVTDASTVATSTNAQDNLIIASDDTHGNYLSFDFSSTNVNSRGAIMKFTGVDVTAEDKYIVEFDAAMTPGNNQSTSFAIGGTDLAYNSNNVNYGFASGYILGMTVAGGSTTYTVNDTATATIPSGEWCHYKLYVDKTQGLVSTTITGDTTGVIMDKVATSYNGNGSAASLYMVGGRYYPVQSVDNIVVRAVTDDDSFGELGEETLSSAEFSTALNKTISQPAEGTSVDYPIAVSATGCYGGDLTDKVAVDWSIVGLDNEDGYVTFTTDGANANVNVRNGVSNYYGYVKAVVSYLDETETITTPFAIIGANSASATQIIPAAGYPVDMSTYPESLVGYKATANGITDKDVVLNNWSIYGSNGSRTLTLVDDNGTKALEFASNGGGGSTVGVYQWADLNTQYIFEITAKATDGIGFGCYSNTPNNSNAVADWSFSISSGAVTAGTESFNVTAGKYYKFVVSADTSVGYYTVAAYDTDGTLVGQTGEVATGDATAKYFCATGGFPLYLSALKAYTPTLSTIAVNSDVDVVKVPDSGEEASTVDLSAALATADGVKITGAVEWSLEEEYANVELTSTGAQTATLTVNEGASGSVTVIATKDGKHAEKTIQLTTSSNVVAFTSSTSSITIPFTGEDAVVADFAAETRNGDGTPIDGGDITYTLLAKDGVTETTVNGVTFENGKMTVAAGASPAVVYVKATNAEGLSTKVKVNIHGLSFAFGSGEPAEGYTQVDGTQYTEKLGYGWNDASAVTTNEANATSSADFRFKANVPNGNYVVTVDTTSATMTSEVVETVSATTGISKSGTTFNVAVCDEVLDLTFLADSTVSSLTISQAAAKEALDKPKVWAIGDSTTNNNASGNISWGNVVGSSVTVPECFSGFSNNGMAGRDSVSFYNQGRVETVLLGVCPGDYVTVNMGINSKETNESVSYYTLLRNYYVQGIMQRGAIPVIVTATPLGFSDKQYPYDATTETFTSSRGDGAHNSDLRAIGEEFGLNVIELGEYFNNYFNSLTMEDVTAYNAENGTEHASVLELVKSWYGDHNHYKQPLAEKIATYILGEVAAIETGETPSETETPATEVPATEVPATEVPATEVPATEVPATEVPATDVPATPAPTGVQIAQSDRTVIVTSSDLNAVTLLHAVYADGRLVSVKAYDLTLVDGVATVTIDTLANGDKLMAWDSLTGMKALTEAKVAADIVATEEPKETENPEAVAKMVWRATADTTTDEVLGTNVTSAADLTYTAFTKTLEDESVVPTTRIIDGVEFTGYISSTLNGSWSGTSLDPAKPTAIKYVATENGVLTAYLTGVGENKTVTIAEEGLKKDVITANGEAGRGDMSISANVEAGKTYYVLVVGSKGRFCGIAFEAGATVDKDDTSSGDGGNDNETPSVTVDDYAWVMSSAYNNCAAGTELMKGLTTLFADTKANGKYITSGDSGKWVDGSATGTALKYVAWADGTLSVSFTGLGTVNEKGDVKTVYIVEENGSQNDPVASVGNSSTTDKLDGTVTAQVTAGTTYYIYGAGTKACFNGATFTAAQ